MEAVEEMEVGGEKEKEKEKEEVPTMAEVAESLRLDAVAREAKEERAKAEKNEEKKEEEEKEEKEENEENEENAENEGEEEEEEDLPPPPHANINGVVWVTRTKNKKKSKQSKQVNVQFVELAKSHQSAAETLPKRRRTATAGVAVFQPGRGKCFVKQRFHKSEPVDSSRLKKVPVERSERMIQISNERERAREEEANVASNFQMNPPAPRRTKNNARARRR